MAFAFPQENSNLHVNSVAHQYSSMSCAKSKPPLFIITTYDYVIFTSGSIFTNYYLFQSPKLADVCVCAIYHHKMDFIE